jgi:hypothetical protein
MERKRTLTDYSDEELFKALEQYSSSESKTQEYETDVPRFLAFYQIKPGKDLINKRLLYKLYTLWSHNLVTTHRFTSDLNMFFKPHQKGHNEYYYINQKALAISEQAFELIKLNTQDRTKIPNWKAHFDKFIATYNLKSGTVFLESYILYNLYDKFVYETGKKAPLGYDQFVNFCRLYFKQERLTSSRIAHFGVDKSIFEFITMQQIRQLRKTHNAKKSIKKVQRKVSSSSSSPKSKD